MKQKINPYKKRRVARKFPAALLFFLVLLPYTFSFFGITEKQEVHGEEVTGGPPWVLREGSFGTEQLPLEDYLLGLLAAAIPPEYEPETLKAQAVLLRSRCFALAAKEGVIKEENLCDIYLEEGRRKRLWGENYDAFQGKIRQAVEETKGMIVTCKGKVLSPPFFRISSGSTRPGEAYEEYDTNWDYVKQTPCENDIRAEEYLTVVSVEKHEFKKKIAELLDMEEWEMEKIILHRDGADYVQQVEIGGMQIPGEVFREKFRLPSAAFSFKEETKAICMEVKGLGHGFGFSQYEANVQAKNGKDFWALLEFFFSEITLEKIVS